MLFKFKFRSKESRAFRSYLKSTFGLRVRDLDLYYLALTHSSVLPKRKDLNQSNERLEFLGDAILDAIIANHLYQTYPGLTEGELTKEKSKIVSRKTLNYLASELGLVEYLDYSINFKTEETSLLGNALEALIGALYLDLGFEKTEKATLKMFSQISISAVLYEHKDYKSLLHEWCQQEKKEIKFRTVNEQKVEGRNEYEVELRISGEIRGIGKAYSKKKAQKIAAQNAYEKIKMEI